MCCKLSTRIVEWHFWKLALAESFDNVFCESAGDSAVDGSVPARNGPVQNRPRGDPYPTRVLFVGPGIKKKPNSPNLTLTSLRWLKNL
jgi:hypothetical protein